MKEAYIYSKHLQIHKNLVATSNPNKNGFSFPLSWRAHTYKWNNGREKGYKIVSWILFCVSFEFCISKTQNWLTLMRHLQSRQAVSVDFPEKRKQMDFNHVEASYSCSITRKQLQSIYTLKGTPLTC